MKLEDKSPTRSIDRSEARVGVVCLARTPSLVASSRPTRTSAGVSTAQDQFRRFVGCPRMRTGSESKDGLEATPDQRRVLLGRLVDSSDTSI